MSQTTVIKSKKILASLKKILKWIFKLEGFLPALWTCIFLFLLALVLNNPFQKKLWEREVKLEYAKTELSQKEKIYDQTSYYINSRYINALRVTGAPHDQSVWNDYVKSVVDFNAYYDQLRLGLAYYYGWDFASIFVSKDVDTNQAMPESIYYKFTKLHNYLIELKNGDVRSFNKANTILDSINNQKDDLFIRMIETMKNENQQLLNLYNK
ncbi:MAG TPA: hypothetical protein VG982_01405 [Candidatus Paceibacterota bacterium]|nr:hypothetical protein [Candidatus Paceibacterota bacterium]